MGTRKDLLLANLRSLWSGGCRGAVQLRLEFDPRTTLSGEGLPSRCGLAAKVALDDLIQDQPVSCTVLGNDAEGHYLVRCTTRDGTDLGRYLVSEGLALAYGPHADAYAAGQSGARREGRGAWSGTFAPPWQWRDR